MAFGLWRFCQLRDARDVWRPLPKYNLGWKGERRLLDGVPVIGAAAGATHALEKDLGEVEIDLLQG